MLARSSEFDTTITAPHTSVAAFQLMDGDQVTDELDVVDFTVSADSQASQLRSVTATVGDPDGTLTPASMADKLGPGGTRARALRGVRIEHVTTVGGPITTAAGWQPTTELGVLNGVIATADGGLTLGYLLHVAVGQATETDTAHPIISMQLVAVGQATETDTAGAFTSAVLVEQAAEVDTANAIPPLQVITFGEAVETDTAAEFTSAVVVGQAVESDVAQPISFTQFVLVDQVIESDTAGAFTSAVLLDQAVEVDTAQPIAVGDQTLYPSESLYPSTSLYPTEG